MVKIMERGDDDVRKERIKEMRRQKTKKEKNIKVEKKKE